VWVDDHLWPWASWQPAPTPFLECVSTITHFATAYPNLTFGSLVFCQGYRTPAVLAKTAANLQLVTGGRFVFGIGAGWAESEYHAYGYEFPKPAVRIAQLAEAVQIVKKLWSEAPATFHGKYYSVTDAYCEPRPDPAPPVLIGGGGEQLTLRVVAKYADWWNITAGTPAGYAHKLDVLRRHCDAVGRDYNEIVKTWGAEALAVATTEKQARRIAEASPHKSEPIVGTPEQVAEQVQAFIDAGVQYLIVRAIDFPSTEGVELFAQEVMPRLSPPH
jgi:alkanesulfonate monooxygenase SsuD/methylene tetrahydromethanopterin reductase-like flavin-dependent oxidoreductase (luciferase family)